VRFGHVAHALFVTWVQEGRWQQSIIIVQNHQVLLIAWLQRRSFPDFVNLQVVKVCLSEVFDFFWRVLADAKQQLWG
jgi:hypothetical protein